MNKLIAACLGLALLAGCAATPDRSRQDDLAVVQRAAYRHDGPPALTLYTMINNRTGAGAHSSLMINGSQRVIFDPAGSVQHSQIPERGDVLYGITPRIEEFYARAHARETFHVVIQRIEVDAATAEKALQLAMENGAVSQAFCAQATGAILRQLPGFESIRPTFFPVGLSEQFGALPGVTSRTLRENDSDDKSEAIARFDAEQRARQGQ
ncbi:hypothetical protein [Marinovum sp.]|uniref:hypothetical protein n=1 Tax=Marinovum sp. TaxID=2024839 RepID=UPI002B277F6C|nr:hypothetical protein [Marinovum sp.]